MPSLQQYLIIYFLFTYYGCHKLSKIKTEVNIDKQINNNCKYYLVSFPRQCCHNDVTSINLKV